jgi:hypothetical protein
MDKGVQEEEEEEAAGSDEGAALVRMTSVWPLTDLEVGEDEDGGSDKNSMGSDRHREVALNRVDEGYGNADDVRLSSKLLPTVPQHHQRHRLQCLVKNHHELLRRCFLV